MKAIFINGSPRKTGNTAQLLQAAMAGAAETGAQTELIHLCDYSFKGCRSCFACKRKGSGTNGICAVRDELRPVLERVMDAEVLVVGTPVYFGNYSAEMLAFLERAMFPVLNYKLPVDGVRPRTLPKEKKTGLLLTMNVPEQAAEALGYWQRFDGMAKNFAAILGDGTCPTVCACNTWQFDDYDQYDVNMFDMEAKARQRAEQFPQDLEAARQLGRTLAEQA